MVHPVPAPFPIKEDKIIKFIDGISIQNLRLFIRGNAISLHPNIIGISQFPKVPIINGITTKKIITKA